MFPRSVLAWIVVSSTVVACSSDPPARGPDTTTDAARDVGAPSDLGAILDAEAHDDADAKEDAGIASDASPRDAREVEDAAPADRGPADARPIDATIVDATTIDASPIDATTPADSGVVPLDSDGDGIDDALEGTGDPDGDNIPNRLDDDSDGDGISDSVERTDDRDGDRLPAFLDTDSDGDGISDTTEGSTDTDRDGLGDWLDVDSDADGIADRIEGAGDVDGDGISNHRDTDADGDGISDGSESTGDGDGDRIPNFLDVDADGDTISDLHEGAADADGDGISNYFDLDSDGDAILDAYEAGDSDLGTAAIDTDGDGTPNWRDTDSDGDTISDLDETQRDTDGDTLPDFIDPDSDDDLALDAIEAGDNLLNTSPIDTDLDSTPDFLDLDSDDDGLADARELGCAGSSERTRSDSDNDGFVDAAEIAFGSSPCNPASGIDDFYFVLPPSDPAQNAPLVFENTEIDRADLAINIDTTGSMTGEIANLRRSLSRDIIPGVRSVIPSAAFGVSSFEDYPIYPFASESSGDVPFRLGTRVTTNGAVAQAAVDALVTRNGLDFPESGIEALHQIATGAGTSWDGGSVSAFDPRAQRVAGVADGAIGGVGFRSDTLPIVVHVTDAPSHLRGEYRSVDTSIAAARLAEVRTALGDIGARVITLANRGLPRPANATGLEPTLDAICGGTTSRFLARIDYPFAGYNDTDWFQLVGVSTGQTVTIETNAHRMQSTLGSTLDTVVALTDGNRNVIASNDDMTAGVTLDSRVTGTLSGGGPYYVFVSAYDDDVLGETDPGRYGWYFLDVTVDGTSYTRETIACSSASDASQSATATRLVRASSASVPADRTACVTTCKTSLDTQGITLPYGLSSVTGALIPACAWDEFGTTRPAGCAVDACCTGVDGAGVAPNGDGLCPLSFQIDADGNGLGEAVVSGIEALVNFSTFEITTVVRPDPAELAASGIDTRCFIHGVIPNSASAPSTCVPTPVAVDRTPPSPELDGFSNVAPGTELSFDVVAQNLDRGSGQACAPAMTAPQLFRAYIDVVADGVTVVDTRDVIIVVPPLPVSNDM